MQNRPTNGRAIVPATYELTTPEQATLIRRLQERNTDLYAQAITPILSSVMASIALTAVIDWCLFHQFSWFYEPLEAWIDNMTMEDTLFSYHYMVGKFLERMVALRATGDNLEVKKIYDVFRSRMKGTRVAAFIQPESAALMREQLPAGISPWLLETVFVGLKISVKGDGAYLDIIPLQELNKFMGTYYQVASYKSNGVLPTMMIDGQDVPRNLEGVTGAVEFFRKTAPHAGMADSSKLYSAIRIMMTQLVVQCIVQLLFKPLLSYGRVFGGRHAQTSIVKRDAEAMISALKTHYVYLSMAYYVACLFGSGVLLSSFFQYYSSRAIITRQKQLYLFLLNQANPYVVSSLLLMLRVLYQSLSHVLYQYRKPNIDIELLENLHKTTRIFGAKCWSYAYIENDNTQRFLVFKIMQKPHNFLEEDMIEIVNNAAINVGLVVSHLSNDQVVLADNVGDQQVYKNFNAALRDYIKAHEALYENKKMLNSLAVALLKPLASDNSVSIEKEAGVTLSLQWQVSFKLHEKYKAHIETVFDGIRNIVSPEYTTEYSGDRFVITGALSLNNRNINDLSRSALKSINDEILISTHPISENNSFHDNAQKMTATCKKKLKRSASQKSGFNEDIDDNSVDQSEKSSKQIIFSTDRIYRENDSDCDIKPLSVPWAPDYVYFVRMGDELKTHPLAADIASKLSNPHYVASKGNEGITKNTYSADDHDGQGKYIFPFKLKFLGANKGDMRVLGTRHSLFKSQTGETLVEFTEVRTHKALKLQSKQ